MNTIEQAAKRLEQLRRAGIDVVDVLAPTGADTVESKPAAIAPLRHQDHVASAMEPSRASVNVSDEGQNGPRTSDAVLEHEHEHEESVQAVGSRRSKTVDLDFKRMIDAGLLVPGVTRSQLEEEIRIIKRPLLDNIRSDVTIRPDRANLIMVTSAVPGEGKTQTAINLAASIAMELDHTVLLVEADVIRPSVLERMGATANRGLLDLLANPGTDLADVLLKTNIPKLTLLPAGRDTSRSTELLASAAMSDLLNELASKYSDRVIIFDTPPVLSTTESRVLATHMGQVVMVVEAGRTPTSTVKQAFATLESHPLVLSMLNKYCGPNTNSTYGYYAR